MSTDAVREALAELVSKTDELIAHLKDTNRLRQCFNLPALDKAQAALSALPAPAPAEDGLDARWISGHAIEPDWPVRGGAQCVVSVESARAAIAAERAEIERLTSVVERVNARCDHLGMSLRDIKAERDELRAQLAQAQRDAKRLDEIEARGMGIERDIEGDWNLVRFRRYGNPVRYPTSVSLRNAIDAAIASGEGA